MADALQPQPGPDGSMGVGTGPQVVSTTDKLEVVVGPLLNYRRMSNEAGGPTWHGSVLVVTTPGQRNPELSLAPVGFSVSGATSGATTVAGEKLYEDPNKAFWRFLISLPLQTSESRWTYAIRGLAYEDRSQEARPQEFVVPAVAESMRIMFHSCNGFSVGTDVEAWSGPALWNDVLRMHREKPFHVMIGGGDQIYNDGVRVDGPLRPWTDIGSPHKRREYPFGEKMRAECDEYYYQNYVKWYGQKPFSTANSQIPQLNIWDDHDIIDGFGSYTDRFMQCAVFRGIGGVAHKYYLLFQHHLAPPKSTFTTDAPATTDVDASGTPADPAQLQSTFVMTNDPGDESYIMGQKPGPYVAERSMNIYCQLGAHIAFAGIDARTERTRHQVNYPETYKLFFDRLNKELAANKEIKHLILLLGVPIAYPRLQWLENIFASPLIAPIKFLNKRFGFGGSIFNKFDGNVDLLDDLDDHYTAHQHKHERRDLVHMLQNLAKTQSVRVSILGGDVHLAAIGRFFSKPKLGIPAEQDWRYMPNIISSAITNKPPPQAVANLLAKRNKIHHLDHETDETLLEIFDRDPGLPGKAEKVGTNGSANGTNGASNGTANGDIKKKTSDTNHATMPSRNYAIIAESTPASSNTTTTTNPSISPAPPATSVTATANGAPPSSSPPTSPTLDPSGNTRKPMHAGELNAGTAHPAANGLRPTHLCGQYGLDVCLRVEINPKDPMGGTDGYGFSIPGLDAKAYKEQGERW